MKASEPGWLIVVDGPMLYAGTMVRRGQRAPPWSQLSEESQDEWVELASEANTVRMEAEDKVEEMTDELARRASQVDER